MAARCDDVVKTYPTASGRVYALRGVTAAFPAGSIVAVAGPSGSGKSSLLRLLAGMDLPTSGSVVVADRSIGRAPAGVRRRLRRGPVGYVFQRPSDNFVPHLTIGEHLQRLADPSEALEILGSLGIDHRADHLPLQLSGGEQQRAAFAQALASRARIIVADEPTAELDGASAAAVLAAIRSLRDRGITLVLATHDPSVVRVADQVLRLDHGEVAERLRTSGRAGPEAVARWVAPPDGAIVLRVRDLSKTFVRAGERVHAVDGASFDVREGELVGLIGRSGSGKTTLLSLIAGWERADRGVIEHAAAMGDGAPSWGAVAVVPQTFGLMDELTIRENVAYPSKLDGATDASEEAIDRLLDALGLAALAERRPTETSVGEQQRAAIARALVLRPTLLLLDEPTCHQDRDRTERVLAAIRDACDAGAACIVATHDEAARRYVDRTLVMRDGRIG